MKKGVGRWWIGQERKTRKEAADGTDGMDGMARTRVCMLIYSWCIRGGVNPVRPVEIGGLRVNR